MLEPCAGGAEYGTASGGGDVISTDLDPETVPKVLTVSFKRAPMTFVNWILGLAYGKFGIFNYISGFWRTRNLFVRRAPSQGGHSCVGTTLVALHKQFNQSRRRQNWYIEPQTKLPKYRAEQFQNDFYPTAYLMFCKFWQHDVD